MATGLAVDSRDNGTNHFNQRFVVEENNKQNDNNSLSRSRSEEPRKRDFVESEFGEIPPETRAKLLVERDEMWRQHERAQIAFLQKEHANMLKSLYEEIEKLHFKCRDLRSQQLGLPIQTNDDVMQERLRLRIYALEKEMTSLKLDNTFKDEQVSIVKEKLQSQEQYYREEIRHKCAKIKELTRDLGSKNALVTQLSSQVHNLRLKEAVERQRTTRRPIPPTPPLSNSYPSTAVVRPSLTRTGTAPASVSVRVSEAKLIRHSSVGVTPPSYEALKIKRVSLPPIDSGPIESIEKQSSSGFRRQPSLKQNRQKLSK